MWVEVIAYRQDQVIFESGVVPAGQPVATLNDPNLWLLRDRILDAQGNEVHMFWEAESYESELLPQASAPNTPHTASRLYHVPLGDGIPDRVVARVLLQPMGHEILQDLVDSGDLDAAVLDALPTFTMIEALEWTEADDFGCVPDDPFTG
jgi:hypothetical protein